MSGSALPSFGQYLTIKWPSLFLRTWLLCRWFPRFRIFMFRLIVHFCFFSSMYFTTTSSSSLCFAIRWSGSLLFNSSQYKQKNFLSFFLQSLLLVRGTKSWLSGDAVLSDDSCESDWVPRELLLPDWENCTV